MALGTKYECKNCGKVWMNVIGPTRARYITYYCNKCGKQKTFKPNRLINEESLKCRCGGIMLEEPTFIVCSKCGSKDYE